VAGDARIAEEGHLAEVAAVVGAANADAMDPHHRLSGAGFGWLGHIDLAKLLRFFELNGFHRRSRDDSGVIYRNAGVCHRQAAWSSSLVDCIGGVTWACHSRKSK
jgi:hypothetical protein